MLRDKLRLIINNKNEEDNNTEKKKIENFVFFVIVLIITIVFINIILNGNKKANNEDSNDSISKQFAENNDIKEVEVKFNSNVEEKLEYILSKIQGVGDVKVFLNYSESSEVIAMYNENSKSSNTEETDTSGGIRKIQEIDSQKDIIYKEENGEKIPITQKVIEPKIEGAIITAKGANNTNIKANIIQAVEAATGLATHKIQVFEMN